jgi:hypothetical protein
MVSDKKIFMGISHRVVFQTRRFLWASSQKPLGQLQPNFGGMILGWFPSKNVSGDPDFQPR